MRLGKVFGPIQLEISGTQSKAFVLASAIGGSFDLHRGTTNGGLRNGGVLHGFPGGARGTSLLRKMNLRNTKQARKSHQTLCTVSGKNSSCHGPPQNGIFAQEDHWRETGCEP